MMSWIPAWRAGYKWYFYGIQGFISTRGKKMPAKLLSADMSPLRVTSGVACVPCSIDHFMTSASWITGAYDEASRMAAAGRSIHNPEIINRLGLARRELDIMERIDLTDPKIMNMTSTEKKIAILAKQMSADLRHDITPTQLRTLDDLMKLSAKGTDYWKKIWKATWDACKNNPDSFTCKVVFPPDIKFKIDIPKSEPPEIAIDKELAKLSYNAQLILNSSNNTKADINLATLEDVKQALEYEKKHGKRKTMVAILTSGLHKKAGCTRGTHFDLNRNKCVIKGGIRIKTLEQKYDNERQGKNRIKVLTRIQKQLNRKSGCGKGQIYDMKTHRCLKGMLL